jgi:hypothetical protein
MCQPDVFNRLFSKHLPARRILGLAALLMGCDGAEDHRDVLVVAPASITLRHSDFSGTSSKRVAVRLSNQGGSTIRLDSAQASCICTHVELPADSRVPPGGERELFLTVTSPSSGAREALVNIQTSSSVQPVVSIPVRVESEQPDWPRLVWSPCEVLLKKGHGAWRAETQIVIAESLDLPPWGRPFSHAADGFTVTGQFQSESIASQRTHRLRTYGLVVVYPQSEAPPRGHVQLLPLPDDWMSMVKTPINMQFEQASRYVVYPSVVSMRGNRGGISCRIAVHARHDVEWGFEASMTPTPYGAIEWDPGQELIGGGKIRTGVFRVDSGIEGVVRHAGVSQIRIPILEPDRLLPNEECPVIVVR